MISTDFLLGLLTGLGVSAVMGVLFWWLFQQSRPQPPPEVPGAQWREVRRLTPGPDRVAGAPRPTGPGPIVPAIHRKLPEPARPPSPIGTRTTPALPGRVGSRPIPVAAPPVSEPHREHVRTSFRVLLHIQRQGRFGPNDIPPWSLSQGGMVEALGITQGALTGALNRLVAAGILEVERSHVRGHDRRVKVYRLTSQGELLVRDLRNRAAHGEGPVARGHEGN